jgi:hypothetical protein
MRSEKEQIRKIVEEERKKTWIVSNNAFSKLVSAKIGSPVQMVTTQGEPVFFFVPLQQGKFTCGFALLDKTGKVLKIGIFGSSADDKESWIESGYFKRPPKRFVEEIKKKYVKFELSKPVFSFDTNPSKWSWLVKLNKNGSTIQLIFISPNGWYIKKPGTETKSFD